MKRLALFLLVLGFARSASAQSLYHYENILLTVGGTPIANASIYVCPGIVSVTNAQPPCTTTTVFANINGSAVKTQPFTSGPLGNYDFYANPGTYTVALVYNNNATADVVTIPSLASGTILSWDGVKYPYTTAGLQQILADCISASTCEQVHLETAGAQTTTISSTISFGSTAKSLTVYFSRSWNPNCTMTNNTDCFVIHAGTSLIGNGTVPITSPQGMTASAGASVSAMVRIIDQDGSNNVGGWLDGFTIIPNATMTISDAVLSIQNPLQLHTISKVSFGGGAWPAGVIGAKIFCTTGKACGNISFNDVQFDTSGSGKPIWIGCTSVGSTTLSTCNQTPFVSFSGAATVLVHPQAGQAVVDIEAGNGAGGVNPQLGYFFDHPQLESSHNTDIGILCNGCVGLTVNGLSASAVVAGADLIKLAQPAGTTLDGINITGVTNQALWTNTFNNTLLSDTVASSTCANGCSYHYHKNASATATEVWADGTGRIMTKGQNGLDLTRGLNTVGNAKGLQLFNTTTTCTTGASIGATCTTAAITLPVAYADTNYRLSCTGQTATNVPIVQTYAKSNTTFTITIAALTAAAATFTSYDCSAVHN